MRIPFPVDPAGGGRSALPGIWPEDLPTSCRRHNSVSAPTPSGGLPGHQLPGPDAAASDAAGEIVATFLQANYLVDEAATEDARAEAAEAVPDVMVEYVADQVIVARGVPVTSTISTPSMRPPRRHLRPRRMAVSRRSRCLGRAPRPVSRDSAPSSGPGHEWSRFSASSSCLRQVRFERLSSSSLSRAGTSSRRLHSDSWRRFSSTHESQCSWRWPSVLLRRSGPRTPVWPFMPLLPRSPRSHS